MVGSRAYGLDDESSDTDRRGVYLPPADLHWSLFGAPEQLEDHANQECYWELQKFLVMALKANPNILECLHTPLVEHAEPLALELLALRGAFLSKLLYKTYNGYVLSQFKKLEQDLRAKGEIKHKHAMHLIRLLHSGIVALETGELVVCVPTDRRAELLAIKRGELSWQETNRLRRDLHARFDAAFARTHLPERPDYAAANDFLLHVTHDARKFFRLVLKKNGYVLEQIFSPLVVHARQPQFEALRDITRRCVTRHHAHHYQGFAQNQWKLFEKEHPHRIKPLLYVYRVLLTGIHLMNTGEVEANLLTLNGAEFHLRHVDELVARKLAGAEQETLADDDVAFHESEFHRLLAELATAAERSPLPELPAGRADLNALLLTLRGANGA